MKTVRAAAAYVAIVFAAGFVLGAVRVVLVAPALGETVAVALETPVILLVSWFTSTAMIDRYRIPASPAHRLAMGAIAFALLMAAETGLSLAMTNQLPHFTQRHQQIGLAAQIGFALVPLLQIYTQRT